MTQQEENKIREEFQKFADSIIWSNDDGTEKYIGVGNMANWWIVIIKQRDEKMVKEIWEFREDTRNDGLGQYVSTIDKCIEIINNIDN